jgi:hypothetical protein
MILYKTVFPGTLHQRYRLTRSFRMHSCPSIRKRLVPGDATFGFEIVYDDRKFLCPIDKSFMIPIRVVGYYFQFNVAS